MHKTQLFENLLQVERKSISLLRALGLQKCYETPLKIDELKKELPEIDGEVNTLVARLGFLSMKDGGALVPLTHQIFSSEVETLSCQIIVRFEVSDIPAEELIGSFKWYQSSMLALKEHLKFESQDECPLQLHYSSVSESAAQAFKEFVQESDKFAKIAHVQIETNMSAQAPDFKPPDMTENVSKLQVEDEVMSAEEVKL